MSATTMNYPTPAGVPAGPEKQSGTNIFTAESTTPAIMSAWAQHRQWHEITTTRKLKAGESGQWLTTLMALKWATRAGKTTGYYQVDGGYLVGWCGPRFDAKFKIVNPAS